MSPFTAQNGCRLSAAIAVALAGLSAHAATITVNSADDNAASTFCNLRDAMHSINNGNTGSTPTCTAATVGVFGSNDTIVFAGSVANATITLTQGELGVINATVTGSGQTIDAGGASRILDLPYAGTTNLSNLTLTNGSSTTFGGAISVGTGASLTLSNCTISNSSAASMGGGIYSNGASVTLTNSTVSGNSATTKGGGIYAKGGTLSLNASTLANNTATGLGGGLMSSYSNILTIDHSTLSGNTGLRSGAAYLGPQSTTTITHSTVSGNIGDCSQSFCTGGIYAFASDVNVIDSTFSGNAASGTKDFQAGAIYLYNANATIVNSTITGNSAQGTSGTGNDYLVGALWELHNPASAQGSLTLVNTTVSGNTASASASPGAYIGGGIAVGIQGTGGDVGIGTLYNTIVSANAPANADILFKPSATTWIVTYNLLGTAQNIAAFNSPSDHNVFSDVPGLGTLANNGGATQTMALLAASPALRAGSAALALYNGVPLYFDQRGSNYTRTFSGTVDIGAFEDQGERIFASEFETEP